MRVFCRYPVFLLIPLLSPAAVAAQSIPVVSLPAPPVVDGNGDDWQAVAAVEVPLSSSQADYHPGISRVWVKAGRTDERVYFYLEWQDATEDRVHKPYVWNDYSERYIQGDKREDRLALQFEISGSYSTDWLSGNEFVADMWHWKASRSDPLGLAHDKSTRVSRAKLLRSYRVEGRDGAPVYILRPSDAGQPLYSTRRYRLYAGEELPKYQLNPAPWGSTADVRAKGVWRDGRWHLELSRYLDTGQDDDVRFVPGQRIRGGIAIFDHSENREHAISDTLDFQF